MAKLLIIVNILVLAFCSNRLLLEESKTSLNITLRHFHDDIIGKRGTLVINAIVPSEFPLSSEKKTLFEAKISDKLKVDCGILKVGDFNYIFCNFNESIPAGEYELHLDGISIEYKDYIFTLVKTEDLIFNKIDSNLIDLYSNENNFNIEKDEKEDKKEYILKFNINSYNKEKIFLSDYYILDNCKQEKNELICPVSRNKLIDSTMPNSIKNGSLANVGYLNLNKNYKKFALISPVFLNYQIPKEDIFIGISKLIQNIGDGNSFIAYETNVTNIANIRPDLSGFRLPFEKENEEIKGVCTFRKYDTTPLLLLCNINNGTYKLKELKEEIIIDKINTRYNFRIQPTKNNELVKNNGGEGCSFIISVYPEILDFTKKNTLTIEYYTREPYLITGLTFNEKANDFPCQTSGQILICNVTKSHFKGKKTGYYYTKQRNLNEGKSILYEIPPIKVILSGSDSSLGKTLSFSFFYSFLLLFIILF